MVIIKRALLLLIAIGLAACEQANILAPTHNSVDITKPDNFSVEFSKGAGIPEDLYLQLNAADVTSLFDVTETGAVANGDALAPYVFNGLNTFRVKAFKKTQQIEFYYDVEGPVIHILDTDKANKVVSGYVKDMAGVQSLTLNGQPVTLNEKNEFSATYTDQDFHTFIAVDGFNHESTTTYASNTNTFTGISARLNQGGLNFLVDVLEEEFNKIDLANFVGNSELVNLVNFKPIGLSLVEIQGKITELTLDGLAIDLETLDGEDAEKIKSHLAMGRLKAGVYVETKILGGIIPFITSWNSYGSADITNLNAETKLLLDIVDSDLDFAISDTTVTYDDLDVRFNKSTTLIGSIIGGIQSTISSFLISTFKPMVINMVESIVVPMLSNFLKDIPIDLRIVTIAEGEELRVTATPNFLDTKEKGITIDLGTRLWAPVPSIVAPGVLGSHYREGDSPTIGASTPEGEAFDFGIAISENVVNQALAAAQEAGITTLHVSPGFYPNLTPKGIAVFTPEGTEIAENDQIGFRFEPASAPVVKFQPAREDGAAGMFVWHDVSFAFDLYKAAWGEYRPIFGITFDLEVPFEVDATDDGYLAIGLEQLPHFRITSQEMTGSIVLPIGFINSSMKFILPIVMPTIAERLKAVALPRIYQHTLNMNDFWVSGSTGNNLALAGSLIPLSVTEASDPPVTEIEEVILEDVVVEVESDNYSGVIVINDYITVQNGEVTIDVNTLNGGGDYLDSLEYRYRVDNGAWSIWKHRDQIVLTNLLAGPHAIEICARNAVMKFEIACPVVEFDTTVVAEPEATETQMP